MIPFPDVLILAQMAEDVAEFNGAAL